MEYYQSKELKNASWLIGGRVAQMVLSLFVGLLTARYLGAANYGLISYAMAYVAFFTSLCTLGINSVIIKDFFEHPDEQGMAIGTTMTLRAVSSLLSALMIVGIVSVIDIGETETILVAALCSLSLIFQVTDTIGYWFQSRYQSKVTSIAVFFGYIIVSIYKITLLVMRKSVIWFAFSSSLDYISITLLYLIVYRKYKGPQLSFSLEKARDLLKSSYHYILSGMMVAIYSQTDKLMIKQMLNETEVGYYSVASYLCTIWFFILAAIIDSIYPTIMRLHSQSKVLYERKNKLLYALVFYISIAFSVFFTLFGELVVGRLYGQAYLPSVPILKVITWYTAFTALGVARNAWIVCENKQKYLKYMYIGAVVINIILNIILIPNFGAVGAAIASLITQIFTSLVLPLIFTGMRDNVRLMIEGITLKDIFP